VSLKKFIEKCVKITLKIIYSGLPVKLIGAKRAAINKLLDKKLELLEKLSGGIGGKSSSSASSSSLDF
jgi:hypothetical protein